MATAYSCCVAITEAKVLGLGCTASGVVIVHKLGQQRLKARVAVRVAESKTNDIQTQRRECDGVGVCVAAALARRYSTVTHTLTLMMQLMPLLLSY